MMAQPIRCVNDTFPPRLRRRWLLMTMRLSISSLAGIDRTLVAVGTCRLSSIFLESVLAMPRSGVTVSSSTGIAPVTGAVRGASAGIGVSRGATLVVRDGWMGAVAAVTAAVVGLDATAAAGWAAGADGAGSCAASRSLASASELDTDPPAYFSRTGHQDRSTEFGSAMYCLYISSTNHAFAPKSAVSLETELLCSAEPVMPSAKAASSRMDRQQQCAPQRSAGRDAHSALKPTPIL